MAHRTMHGRGRTAAVSAAFVMLLALLPMAGVASAHRDVPNNACASDRPQADFRDRREAAEAHRRNLAGREIGTAEVER